MSKRKWTSIRTLEADDLAVCAGGLYYVNEDTLYYYGFASGHTDQILKR